MVLHNRNIKLSKQVWDGLDFVMEMFDVPRFPRNVFTGSTRSQKVVDSRDRAMTYFEAARYEDCYMNAYLNYDAMTILDGKTPGYKPVPNHIMIDLDREPFDSDGELQVALDDTLRNIKANITGISGEYPPVIASGSGGYHIHVPLPGMQTALQDMPEFEVFKADQDLADKFLRFAERRLTDGKADHCHNPSIKSCLFRIPGTINTKTNATVRIMPPNGNTNETYRYSMLRIAERMSLPEPWYSEKASKPTTRFLNDFYAYLIQQQINNEIAKSDRRLRSLEKGHQNSGALNSIWWIDRLLSVGIDDGRKDLLYWVLAPYLITVRKMDYDKAHQALEQWLEKCGDVRRLEPGWSYFRYRVKYCLESAESHERLPIRFETFQEYYPYLCGVGGRLFEE